jgi:hypothetical protein
MSFSLLWKSVSASVFTLALASTSAGASPVVTCVQEQLAAAGFDPGGIDGQIGANTRAALSGIAEGATGLPKRRLDLDSAIVWCRFLGLHDPALKKFWPSSSGAMRYVLGDSIKQPYLPQLLGAAEAARQSLVDITETELADKITVLAASSSVELLAVFDRHTNGASVSRALRSMTESSCTSVDGVGGFALPALVAICRDGETYFQGAEGAEIVTHVIAHEFFHAFQYQLIGGPLFNVSERQRLSMEGPLWLIEGSAQLFSGLTLGLSEQGFLDWARRHEPANNPGLERMESRSARESHLEEVYRFGSIAAGELAVLNGFSAFTDFYEDLGANGDWPAAFERAFDVTPQEFYAAFSNKE